MLSFAILIFLPSFPFAAWFLSPRERAIAHARLNRDQKPQMEGGWTGWQSFKAVVADPNAWLLLVTYGSCESPLFTVDSVHLLTDSQRRRCIHVLLSPHGTSFVSPDQTSIFDFG